MHPGVTCAPWGFLEPPTATTPLSNTPRQFVFDCEEWYPVLHQEHDLTNVVWLKHVIVRPFMSGIEDVPLTHWEQPTMQRVLTSSAASAVSASIASVNRNHTVVIGKHQT